VKQPCLLHRLGKAVHHLLRHAELRPTVRPHLLLNRNRLRDADARRLLGPDWLSVS
jgi:hypothetical protein